MHELPTFSWSCVFFSTSNLTNFAQVSVRTSLSTDAVLSEWSDKQCEQLSIYTIAVIEHGTLKCFYGNVLPKLPKTEVCPNVSRLHSL